MEVSNPVARPAGFRLVLVALFAMVLGGGLLAGPLGPYPDGFSADPGAGGGFRCERYEPLAPSGGVARPVANQSELAAALAEAGPGDTINLATGVYSRIDYRLVYGHRSGTPAAPIVIQAAAGASPVIDAGDGGRPGNHTAVLVRRLSHVTIRGLEIRNGFFGAATQGGDSITFEHNQIHRLGHAAVVAQAMESPDGFVPSSNIDIRCNSIHHAGITEPQYGEGVYVGTGRTGAVDRTSGVVIEGNEIHAITNEAIDVKRHTTGVTIRHNLIHDVTPHFGGAISLGLNRTDWGPANYLVEHNRIWNVSSGRYYAQAIAVAHGPTVIRNNVIWGIETRISESRPRTAAIQVHGDGSAADSAYGFGNPTANSVDIVGNTVIGCNQGCISSYTDPGQIKPSLNVHGNIVDWASTGDATNSGDVVVAADDLIGPVTGDADAGSGPGSGLTLRSGPPSTTSPPTTSRPPTTASRSTSTARPRRATTSSSTNRAPTVPDRPEPARRSPTAPTTPTSRPNPGGSPTQDRWDWPPARTPGDDPITSTGNEGRPQASSGPASTSRASGWSDDRLPEIPGRRRAPSDLRLFLDLNLGSELGSSGSAVAATNTIASGAPAWLAAIMIPTDDHNHHRAGAAGRATTTTPDGDRASDVPSNDTTDGFIPNTTHPGSTGPRTSTGGE